MHIVIADCSAIYTGRGDTSLARGVRSLIIKRDGSVSIHNDVGNKPLNYMKEANCVKTVNSLGEVVWTFDSRKESLSITMHKIIAEHEYPLIEDDAGLVRDGTEDHVQAWLAENPAILGDRYELIGREFQTGKGPVDLLVVDEHGSPIAVEVKRVATLSAVDQCRRYVDALRILEAPYNIDFTQTRGMIAGLDIRPKTLEWAEKKNIQALTLPMNWRELAADSMAEPVLPEDAAQHRRQQAETVIALPFDT